MTKYFNVFPSSVLLPMLSVAIVGMAGCASHGDAQDNKIAGDEAKPIRIELGVDGATAELLDGSPRTVQRFADRIYVAGTKNRDFWVAAHLGSGVADLTFGNNGSTTFSFPPGEPFLTPSDIDVAFALEVTNSQILVAGGVMSVYSSILGNARWGTMRMGMDGVVDPTFGEDGGAVIDWTVESTAFQVHSDSAGRIYVGGTIDNLNSTDAAIVRLKSDGQLDDTFSGTDGGAGSVLATPDNDFGLVMDVMDQRVVIGGGQFALDALDLQGKPDPAFADASWPELDDTLLNSMVRLDNGKLLLAGIEATYQSENDDDEEPVRAILVVRLLADGTPDRSYGVDGVARLTYNVKDYLFPGEELGFAAGQLGNVRGLALLDDGGALIYAQSVNLPSHPLLLRLSPDGEWDRSFGQNGVVAFSLDYALLLDPLVPGSRLVVDKNIAWFADDFWFRGGEYWTTDELTALLVRVELDRL